MSEKTPKIWKAVILLIAGGLLGSVFILLAGSLITSLSDIYRTQILMGIGETLYLVPVLWWLIRHRAKPKQLFRLNPVSLQTIFYTLIMSLGLIVVLDELDRLMAQIIPVPNILEDITAFMKISSPGTALVIIAVVVLWGPLTEELLFRGFFQQILETRLRDVTRAVLLSSLAFTIFHSNPWRAVQILIMGVFLGYLGWRANSIWPPFILHVINNGISVTAVQFSEEELGVYLWHGHVNPLIILAAVTLAWYGMKQFNLETPVFKNGESAEIEENVSTSRRLQKDEED